MTASGFVDPDLRGKSVEEALASPELMKKVQGAIKKTRQGYQGVTDQDQTTLVEENAAATKRLQEHLANVAKIKGEEGLREEIKVYNKMSLYNPKRAFWAAVALIRELFHINKPLFMAFAVGGVFAVFLSLAFVASALVKAGGGEFIDPGSRALKGVEGIFEGNR